MKSKKQKRVEANERANAYLYENSKAKRNGVSYEEWRKALDEYIKRTKES